MEQEGQITRGLCYACFPGSSKPVDEELLTRFANAVSPASVKIVKSFVDIRNKKSPRNRPNWNAVLEECQFEDIDYIVIPAISMLSYHLSTAIEVAREVRKKYNIKIHFLYEDICTGGEETDQELYVDILSAIDYESHRSNRISSLKRGYGPFWESRKKNSENPIGTVAYIGFPQKSMICSDEKMLTYLRNLMPEGIEIKAVYSDFKGKGKYTTKEGWTNAVSACGSPDIGLLIVSSADVIGKEIMDIVAFTKHMEDKNGVETYFLIEDIYSGDVKYEAAVALHCAAMEAQERFSKRKEKLKEVFRQIAADYED